MRGRDAVVEVFRILAGAIVTVAVILAADYGLARADHNGHGEAWRRAALAACEPVWNPADPRIVTWNGRTLHGEAADTKDLFWRHWQLPYLATPGQPSRAELDGGVHLRRWRWEYECTHPRPDTQSGNGGSDGSSGDGSARDEGAAETSSAFDAAAAESASFAGYHFSICTADPANPGASVCRVNPEWPVLEWRNGQYFRCKGLTEDGRGQDCKPY